MHTGAQRKIVSRADGRPARRAGKKSPLLDCTRAPKGRLSAELTGARRGGQGKIFPTRLHIHTARGSGFMKIPQHVAIILDGNGRWAADKGMPRNYGHGVGAKNVEKICDVAGHMGIRYLTVYAFSTENWSRPQGEVDELMRLLGSYMKTCKNTAKKHNMRVRVLGDITRLSPVLQQQIRELEEFSSRFDGFFYQIALNYGSRDEMIRGMKKMLDDAADGKLEKDALTEDVFSGYLDTAGIPDPDLLIRTSGEQRLSNFLLWQLAYSEFYFTDVHWPDFDAEELKKAVAAYNKRERRFGGLSGTAE